MFQKRTSRIKLLSTSLLLLFVLGCANSAFAKVAQTPEQTAVTFYKWYLQVLNANKNPIDQKQKLLGFLSKRLGKWIYSKEYEEYGADYFLNAQDWDEKWIATTSKTVIKGNAASLKVMLAEPKGKKSDWKHNLTLKMVKETAFGKLTILNNESEF